MILHQTPPGKTSQGRNHGYTGIAVGDSGWHTEITNEEIIHVMRFEPFIGHRVFTIHTGTALAFDCAPTQPTWINRFVRQFLKPTALMVLVKRGS